MIKMLSASGRSAPVLMCDVCGERIKLVGMGAAVFPRSDSDGAEVEVLHVHKGECHDKAESRVGSGKGAPWQELGNHFSYLLHNIGLPMSRLQELEQSWSLFGDLP